MKREHNACMRIFDTERSPMAYRFDLIFYGIAPICLVLLLSAYSPNDVRYQLLLLILAGIFLWTLIEYAIHRFVLHGLPPFSQWHAQHHHKPNSRICLPTAMSLSLIQLLVFLPCLLLMDFWHACSLTLGVLVGYAIYTHVHHALHQSKISNAWLIERKIYHAHHHARHARPGHYGVITQFWDRLFGTR
jgi:sterol desaturase/sphingolipid hydroxylase (fatty acid hydroxylase superfamily)